MNDEISHLTPAAAALLAESDDRRIRAIRSRRWVLYPRAKQAFDRLSRLVDHPRGTRMPSVSIYGDSGMVKTMIMKKFRDEHPPSFSPVTDTLRTPVLAMEMTSRPGERRFYAERRIQTVVAIPIVFTHGSNASSASAGVFQPSVFLGRELRAAATAAISSAVWMLRSVPFGKY